MSIIINNVVIPRGYAIGSPAPPTEQTAKPIESAAIEKQHKETAKTAKPTESAIAAIEKQDMEREKLIDYCNGDSKLLAAAYENFTAEQIRAFVEDFL